jgi:hypothetical protein
VGTCGRWVTGRGQFRDASWLAGCHRAADGKQLHPAPSRVGDRRRGRHRLQGGQRGLPESARAARGPARRERAVRVHDLDRHRARTAARRGRDRAVRSGDDHGGRCGQLPALGRRNPRDRREGAAACANQCTTAPSRRAARRVAVHTDPPGAAPAVLQHDPGQRPNHGDLAAARRPHARPPRVRTLAVRPRVRTPCVGGLVGSRLARRLVARFGRHKVMLTAGGCARAGRSGWPSSAPALPGLCLSSPSSLA